MFIQRIYPWSCSKFADFIRGEKKPYALQWHEWDEWKNRVKSERPIRYWLAEKGLRKLENIVYFPADVYRTISVYIRNRWIDKTHMLHTGLTPGHYYEFDTKVLHGLFNELVDYVEVELAGMQTWKNEQTYKFLKGKCAEAGLDYLEWACNLKYDNEYGMSKQDKFYGKLTPQAVSAQKVRELYEWWTITRPNRPDPHVVAKYDSSTEDALFSGKLSAKDRARLNKIDKIEKAYDKEDTAKLIELIKIRKEIWT